MTRLCKKLTMKKLTAFLRDESGGATQYVAIAIGIGMLLLVPIFVNFMGLYTSRRVAQTGADAAALAAATEYAKRLSYTRTYSGLYCGESPSQIMRRAGREHRSEALGLGNSRWVGQGWAQSLAASNQTRLTPGFFRSQYGSPTGHHTNAFGIPINAIAVFVRVEKTFSPVWRDHIDVPARANAEAYMLQPTIVRTWTTPCGKDEPPRWHVTIRWEWKTTLIR